MLDPEASRSGDEVQTGALEGEVAPVPAARSSSEHGQLALSLSTHCTHHLRFLRSRLPSIEDAEDALQDATLKLLSREDLYAGANNPEAWIAVALRNVVIDHYRRAAAQKRLMISLSKEPAQYFEGEAEEALVPIACLKAALSDLKSEYASVLTQVIFRIWLRRT